MDRGEAQNNYIGSLDNVTFFTEKKFTFKTKIFIKYSGVHIRIKTTQFMK